MGLLSFWSPWMMILRRKRRLWSSKTGVGDTYEFYREVDQELADDIDVLWDGPDIHDLDGNTTMMSLVNVLQTAGVDAGDAVQLAMNVITALLLPSKWGSATTRHFSRCVAKAT